MIKRLKAQFRAWLIGAMRDAIRLEYYAQQNPSGGKFRSLEEGALSKWGRGSGTANAINTPFVSDRAIYPGRLVDTMPKPAPKPSEAPIPDPSFEQMQAEAIQAQEKYYEPAQ